jgi:hypothetical protein
MVQLLLQLFNKFHNKILLEVFIMDKLRFLLLDIDSSKHFINKFPHKLTQMDNY